MDDYAFEPSRQPVEEVATKATTQSDAAAMPRDLYTLTVEAVAVMLADQNVPRDRRTIQRWCKSGKLKAIIDYDDGEKYLIEPTSTHKFIATLVAEKRRQDEEFAAMSRQQQRQDATPSDTVAAAAETARFTNADSTPDVAEQSRDAEATSNEGRDNAATLETRLAMLEEENRSLRIDKQARDQVISMIREEYQKAIDHALERSEQVGSLQAEVRQLRQLLPPEAGEGRGQPQISFTPKSIHDDRYYEGDNSRRDNFDRV